jgi:DNA replication protein DnaC
MKDSGLEKLLEKYTFSNFKTSGLAEQEKLLGKIKALAMDFINYIGCKWFYIGGQPGSGKTHICTAMCGEFLKSGKSVRYMLWRDEVVPLRAAVNNEYEYSRLISPLKSAQVLYIDDFFKVQQGKYPTPGDVNIACEILYYRYINPDLITIISGEKNFDELLDIDEGLGSRIYEKSKGFRLIIPASRKYNYRMG